MVVPLLVTTTETSFLLPLSCSVPRQFSAHRLAVTARALSRLTRLHEIRAGEVPGLENHFELPHGGRNFRREVGVGLLRVEEVQESFGDEITECFGRSEFFKHFKVGRALASQIR